MAGTRKGRLARRNGTGIPATRVRSLSLGRIAAGTLLVLACGAPDADGSREGDESGTSGTRVDGWQVVNSGPGAWSEDERWSARLSLRIGNVEGEGGTAFRRIAAISVGPDGSIYVLEGQTAEVRVFDSAGGLSAVWGGGGDGPGEFRSPGGMGVTATRELVVADWGSGRLTVFDSLGNVMRETPIPTLRQVSDFGILPDGTGMGLITTNHCGPEAEASCRNGVAVVRVGSESVDTLPPITWPVTRSGEGLLPFPYAERRVVSIAPDGGVWFANPYQYRLWRRGPTGDTMLVTERDDVVGLPLDGRVVDDLLESLREAARQYPGALTIPDREDFPTRQEVILEVMPDGEDHVLVFPRGDDGEVGRIVDVFRATDGAFLGRVELPLRVEIDPVPVMRNGQMYAIALGEFDVLTVVRIELEGYPR